MLANPSYSNAVAIVPSLTVNFDGSSQAAGAQPQNAAPATAIYVGGAGTVPVVLPNGTVITFTCIAGQTLPVRGVRVNTGGSATLMVALYE